MYDYYNIPCFDFQHGKEKKVNIWVFGPRSGHREVMKYSSARQKNPKDCFDELWAWSRDPAAVSSFNILQHGDRYGHYSPKSCGAMAAQVTGLNALSRLTVCLILTLRKESSMIMGCARTTKIKLKLCCRVWHRIGVQLRAKHDPPMRNDMEKMLWSVEVK